MSATTKHSVLFVCLGKKLDNLINAPILKCYNISLFIYIKETFVDRQWARQSFTIWPRREEFESK